MTGESKVITEPAWEFYDLEKNPYGGDGTGEVTGFWNDGTPFKLHFNDAHTYPQIV